MTDSAQNTISMQDKVVVVTGAAGGIGEALARMMSERGARVVISDIDAERAHGVAERLGATLIAGDAASEEGVTALIETVTEEVGPIDAWFANAGVDLGRGLGSAEEDWARSWQINVMAHVRAARLLVPGWVERGAGWFISTASAAGLLTMIDAPAYSVTKHGAVAFAEWLSATYRHQGVRVHTICPQGVQTSMLERAGELQSILGRDRVLTPDEVAEATWEAMQEGRLLVLPHPEVREYYRARAHDTDGWIAGMNRLQQKLESASDS
ncbi:MAG: SDR family oxidoreductase [Actinomycetia bacterium]|nr:SDR family oxidoreductase [Actinomycetes bacterium]